MDQLLARVLSATAGCLLAVLWMDLMFDVQYFSREPVDAVTSIATYYRRVTLDAGWMSGLIATVMLVTIVGVVIQVRISRTPRWRRAVTAVLAFAPITLALVLVVPAARELGASNASVVDRLELVRFIAWSHLGCFASMACFLATQIRLARAA